MNTPGPTYIAAPPGELYWRREVCPHPGAKVLLKTIGGIAFIGNWGRTGLGETFVAWCPLPKDGEPPANIREATLLKRIVFALKLIFQPSKLP